MPIDANQARSSPCQGGRPSPRPNAKALAQEGRATAPEDAGRRLGEAKITARMIGQSIAGAAQGLGRLARVGRVHSMFVAV